MLAVRAPERYDHRRVLLIACDDPRFFAGSFDAPRARHRLDVIDGARLDAWFVSHRDSTSVIPNRRMTSASAYSPPPWVNVPTGFQMRPSVDHSTTLISVVSTRV